MASRRVAERRRLAPKDPYARQNPKDIVASFKLPTHLIPETAIIEESLAYLEGKLKYGKYNWRARRVLASVYIDAMDRHLLKFKAGSDRDPKTLVFHLAYIRCCCGILLDAMHYGTLVDDRAPRGPNDPDMDAYIDSLQEQIKKLHQLFKGYNPKQYTIQDQPRKRRK